MDTDKEQMFEQLKQIGREIGIVPVKNPPHEDYRIEELIRLGITEKNFETDRRYNNVTQIASYLTDCPVSVINILGSDSQFCKLSSGLNEEQKNLTSEIPRDLSICQYVLSSPSEQLVIENLDEDDRTKNFHKLQAPINIKFYAGTPLVSSRGFALGTLCVFRPEPSTLNHSQRQGLRLLSDQIVTLIEQDNFSEVMDKQKTDSETTISTEPEGQYFSSATIMFTDFVGFTRLVENLQPGELLSSLTTFFSGFDQIITKHQLTKVKTIGDSYMCVGGVPDGKPTFVNDTCAAALDLLNFVEGSNMQNRILGKPDWPVRIGIHTGPLIAGYSAGNFDVWGDAVNIASRLESSGEAGKVHVSEATYDFLGTSASVTARGQIDLKNKGLMNTFFLEKLC